MMPRISNSFNCPQRVNNPSNGAHAHLGSISDVHICSLISSIPSTKDVVTYRKSQKYILELLQRPCHLIRLGGISRNLDFYQNIDTFAELHSRLT